MAQGQQRAEIRVRRNENPIFRFRQRKYDFVGGSLKSSLAYMHRVETKAAQPFCDNKRQRVVDQKLHDAASGNSRSRTASAA